MKRRLRWSVLSLLIPTVIVGIQDVAAQCANSMVERLHSKGGYFNPTQEFRRAIPGDPSSVFEICAIDDIEEGEVSTATEDVAVQRANSMVEWLHSRGGYFNPKQEFRREIPGDPSSAVGIFAIEDIEKGEVTTSVPWKCMITAGADTFSTNMMCDSTRVLIEELKKGEKSFYAPTILYLRNQTPGILPSAWSEEGKDFMDLIDGGGMLPPDGMTEWLDTWKTECKGSDDQFEINVALQFLSRSDDDRYIPVYDMHNHRNGPWYNTHTEVVEGEKQEITASRYISKGEQLYVSYNQCANCGNRKSSYGTPELLRDYGFVEAMPQRWIFHAQDFSFDVTEENGKVEVVWSKDKSLDKYVRFLHSQLRRLQEVVEPQLQRAELDKKLPQHELDTIRKYYDALTLAISSAIQDSGISDDRQECQSDEDGSGVCIIEEDEKQMVEDEYNLDDMGEEDEDIATCNNERVLEFEDYEIVENIESIHQTINFMYSEEDGDMVMDLDDTVQIASSYRPHYHEYVTHFAARYKESIRRAVVVGGGDSMLLHELLKYPDIELIVVLELDQVIVRRSFEHFHTQPHFDDERVQWWFGDATKSLLMLPKEYFGTFDLVLMDLGETATEELDILEALALLLKPDGTFVKNKSYMDELSEIFDYTIQMYFKNIPIICDQAVVIGSNSVDFLHPNFNTVMKGHDVEMLLLEPIKDIKDCFRHVNAYQKNDARADEKCVEHTETTGNSEGPSAGILMIVEAENSTEPLEWKSLEGALFSALQKEGLTPFKAISHPSKNDGAIGVIVMGEGIVVARTWAAEKYCGFDIQLWGAFNKMESVRNALAEVVGSSNRSLSSYRIVTGGMLGTKTWADDGKTIGPRFTQMRDCEEKSVSVGSDVSIDESTISIALEESLNLIHNKDVVVAVLCGNPKDSCKSLDILAKNKNVREVVALYACPSIENAPYRDHGLTRMFECEVETLNVLREAVAKTERLSAFFLDASANIDFAKIAERMFRNPRNQKRLLMPHSLFVSTMMDETETWRRNFLGRCRRYIKYHEYGILNRAEVTLKSADSTLELGVVSTGDPDFYPHLLDIADSLERRTGLETVIPKIEGGPSRFQVDYNDDTRFSLDAYDTDPAKDQYSKQRPLGDQLILQLHVKNSHTDMAAKLQYALSRSLEEADFTNFNSEEVDELGDGVALVAVSLEGSAIVVWDGDSRVDINLFVYESERTDKFFTCFKKTLKKSQVKAKVLLRDEQPRGTGRVINFRDDIEAKLNPPLENSDEGE